MDPQQAEKTRVLDLLSGERETVVDGRTIRTDRTISCAMTHYEPDGTIRCHPDNFEWQIRQQKRLWIERLEREYGFAEANRKLRLERACGKR